MRCDEIQERFVELLYNERGTPACSPELAAHIESCPACRSELEGLRQVQTALRNWKDEPPLFPVQVPWAQRRISLGRAYTWRFARYAAAAALLFLSFLALANAEITWNKDGFSFKTHFLSPGLPRSDYYTKTEFREILKRVLDDSEARMTDTNGLMMRDMWDAIDRDRMMDMRFIRSQFIQSRNKN